MQSKPEISIPMAALRPHKWEIVYNSIKSSTNRSFELVIVSPEKKLPESLLQYNNIRHFQDFGSPMRAAQIAMILCESDIICGLMADDGEYLPGAIDRNVDLFLSMGNDYKNVLVCKYLEGINGGYKHYQPDAYYLLNYHDSTRIKNIPDNWLGMNNVIMYRKLFEELGGWNCEFEACPMGLADLAVRSNRYGANIQLNHEPIVDFDWFPYPGDCGDHGPIYFGQTEHDQPLYAEIYSKDLNDIPIKIDLMNWKKSPSVWKRRFTI